MCVCVCVCCWCVGPASILHGEAHGHSRAQLCPARVSGFRGRPERLARHYRPTALRLQLQGATTGSATALDSQFASFYTPCFLHCLAQVPPKTVYFLAPVKPCVCAGLSECITAAGRGANDPDHHPTERRGPHTGSAFSSSQSDRRTENCRRGPFLSSGFYLFIYFTIKGFAKSF